MLSTQSTVLRQVLRRCIHTTAVRGTDGKMRERCLNRVTLLGRIGSIDMVGKDSNHPFVSMSLATHNYYKNAETEEFTQYTEWHRVKVFKPSLRDTVYIYAATGNRILVEGELRYRTYTSESDTTVKESYINADNVIFLASNK